jgi:hypothetical protein
MGGTNRRRYAFLGATCALIAAGIAAGVVLTFSGTSQAAPTKKQYFARVAAICRVYGPQLDRIVPADIAEPANVIETMKQAYPLLKGETNAVRALRAPVELRAKLRRWLDLHDRRLAKLEDALRAARKLDLRTMSVAYTAFTLDGPKAASLGAEIGIPHPPC